MNNWRKGYLEHHGHGGTITAEEQNGRHYFYASVQFPKESDWWPRTTETGQLQEARDWIDEQEADWSAQQRSTKADDPE